MTRQTLIFLRDLLAMQTLNVGADDFIETAGTVMRARAELDEALADDAAEGER